MKKAATEAITSPRAAAFVNSLVVVFYCEQKNTPRDGEVPGRVVTLICWLIVYATGLQGMA